MKKPIQESILLLAIALLIFGASANSFAGSATWQLNPVSSDWHTTANWMPNTVPNGPADTATYSSSNVTNVTLSDAIEVSGITFSADASQFTTTLDVGTFFRVTGAGFINNSTAVQTFTQLVTEATTSLFLFFNSATAGERIIYYNPGGDLFFFDSSDAGKATFMISGFGTGVDSRQGHLDFGDSSTAAEATIATTGFAVTDFGDSSNGGQAMFMTDDGGAVLFDVNSSAGQATFECNGGTVSGRGGGGVDFHSSTTAAEGHFTLHGAAVAGAIGADTSFSDSATADNGVFVLNGGAETGAAGATMEFFEDSTAGNATVTANGGSNGGEGAAIFFFHHSQGGTASFKLSDNAQMDIGNRAQPGVTIGSLEGDGLVFLGPKALVVGSNDRNTAFSGIIQDGGINQGAGGSLSKIGTGTLKLSGASTYTGGTTLDAGGLVINNRTGSGTGTGVVQVSSGTLGGGGTISGAITLGTGSGAGALLVPGMGASKATALTIQSTLSFKADSTYECRLNTKKRKSDQIVANGVTIESGAQFNFKVTGNKRLRLGKSATLIDNTSANPISGEFSNLADGLVLTQGPNRFQVDYQGGDGNDLTLTVVP